ncbi:hypothetical protein CASFOL_016851 [Castilleja foliolosa]|uniref:Pectinesterase inhibitor domain-containing protein n=1 Tax=Castilleja foliolosa TaxID=1961234 RepID=A0ABD3DCK4_9LAMI
MSPSNLISSIFLLSLIISNIAAISSTSLIETACSNPRLVGPNTLSCIQTLKAQPDVVSAKNTFELAIAIMKAGISSAIETGKHIDKLLGGPHVGPELQSCKTSYDDVVKAIKSALEEVKDDKEFDTATYDLLIGCTDTFQPCLEAAGKINDPIISNGNNAMLIYGLSAYQAIDSLADTSAGS